jgi:hypothetical protein
VERSDAQRENGDFGKGSVGCCTCTTELGFRMRNALLYYIARFFEAWRKRRLSWEFSCGSDTNFYEGFEGTGLWHARKHVSKLTFKVPQTIFDLGYWLISFVYIINYHICITIRELRERFDLYEY